MFIRNVLEDIENYWVETLNSEKLLRIRVEEDRVNQKQKSVDYKQTDIVYLAQEGFSYDSSKDWYIKEEDIDYGKYQGKYEIILKFPEDYPTSPPNIFFTPLFKGKKISPHLIGDDYMVCISEKEHGREQSYWKKEMNARGALRLSYNIVAGTYNIREKTRKKVPLKGTIYEELQKVVKKERFIKEFIKKYIKEADDSYTWEELAFCTSQLSQTKRALVVDYYNEVKDGKTKKS